MDAIAALKEDRFSFCAKALFGIDSPARRGWRRVASAAGLLRRFLWGVKRDNLETERGRDCVEKVRAGGEPLGATGLAFP